jgi:hypothetical protein
MSGTFGAISKCKILPKPNKSSPSRYDGKNLRFFVFVFVFVVVVVF